MLAAELVTSVTRSPRRIDIIRARLPMCASSSPTTSTETPRAGMAGCRRCESSAPPRVAGKTGKNFPETGNLYLVLGSSVGRGAPRLRRGASERSGELGRLSVDRGAPRLPPGRSEHSGGLVGPSTPPMSADHAPPVAHGLGQLRQHGERCVPAH